MFNYTILTEEEITRRCLSRKIWRMPQDRANRAVQKGLRTIRIEAKMKLATLRKRILKEGLAYTQHIPCPLLSIQFTDDGPMVAIAQPCIGARGRLTADDAKMGTIIPLRDYWRIVLSTP